MAVVEEVPIRGDIVGRLPERHRIEEALSRAATEGGVAVLISGETGVGKTALARHALTRAQSRGFVALEGGSSPLGRDLAYGPLVQALGAGLRSFEPPERDRVVADLPALGSLFVGLGLPAPEPLSDAALERTRLFEAVLRLLDRMSRRAPLAILLDDLHWFDHASIEVLAYVTRDLPGLPILVIGTYRSEDDHPEQLRHLLQTLRRAGVAVEMELPSLNTSEVGELTRRILGDHVSENVVERLVAHSGGVPLFAEALINTLRNERSLREEGDVWMLASDAELSAPPVVREAIRERLGRLTEDQRRLVELIAVGGGRVTREVLSEVADGHVGESALAHLTDAGLVVENAGAELTYEFAHPLILEVVYEDIPAQRGRTLHARFADVLETAAPDDLDGLAFHYRAALPDVDATRAIEASVAAGRKALDRYANAEALTHLTEALQLVGPEPDRTEVLLLTGEARFRLGDVDGAVSTWEEALVGLEHDPVMAAKIHLNIARALSEVPSKGSERHVQAGLAALYGPDPDGVEVELRYVSVINAHRQGELARIDEAVRHVSIAAEKTGTDRARALAVLARIYAMLDRFRYDEGEAILEAEESILRGGGAELELRGLIFRAVIAAARGELLALRETNRRAVRLVRESGLPTAGARLQIGMYVEAFYEGNWERAEEIVTEARVMAETIEHRPTKMLAALMGAILHVYRAEFEAASDLLESHQMRLMTDSAPVPYSAHVLIGAALLALEQDDAEGALNRLDRVSAPWVSGSLPPWEQVVRGEALARLGRAEEALEIARRLTDQGGEGSYPEAMAHRIQGLVHETQGNRERALRFLRKATATFKRLGMPFEEARAGMEQAEVAVAGGVDTDDLAPSVERWYEIAVGLGARRYVDRARRLLHAMDRPVPLEDTGGDLTPRQLEVAELVAEGLSNAEIAESLFISVRTVESHLDHIYTRLGLNSRVSLTTYLTTRKENAPT